MLRQIFSATSELMVTRNWFSAKQVRLLRVRAAAKLNARQQVSKPDTEYTEHTQRQTSPAAWAERHQWTLMRMRVRIS